MPKPNDTRTLLRQALDGRSLAVDGTDHSLHELTQLAVALRPGADLAIRNAAIMSPIERASIATVGKGRVLFV